MLNKFKADANCKLDPLEESVGVIGKSEGVTVGKGTPEPCGGKFVIVLPLPKLTSIDGASSGFGLNSPCAPSRIPVLKNYRN